MLFPIRLVVELLTRIPEELFPEMTFPLPSPGFSPPITLLLPETSIPWLPLPRSIVPVGSVPM